ncbi:modulator of drug activity B [Conyzicola lurida]|uniref:Modulator of drug activity B n=1 Tax=Conyzicola lurida TaxID=1172621 RepID=A0A841ALX7_9MICO|nr:NAD(P)H-dependent oxidoreductase [Conyzicola lurida]MBB5843354.1 modulator of drug activity B [Conyzicola lurida]
MKIHIVNAHLVYPDWTEGGLNRSMADRARDHLRALGHEVTETAIEDGVDPESEVQRYIDADLVILQTPINWFGAPWPYKRYVDEVFNAGLHSRRLLDNDGRTRSDPTRQYGTGGHMHGKGFFVAATWSAPAGTFGNPDSVLFEGKTVDDLLLGISASYRFVGFTVLQSYGIFDIFRGTDITAGIEDYTAHVDAQLAVLAGAGKVQL